MGNSRSCSRTAYESTGACQHLCGTKIVAHRYAIHINRLPATGQIAPGPLHLSECHCSATPPTRPAPHGGPVGACTPLTGFPVLPRLPSSMHAGATTPADAARCTCRFSSRATDGLPLTQGGSASALPVSRPAQRSLHVPACMVAELLNATLLSGVLQSMSLPPRTAPAATSRKRQLLGGIRTHQENAPFHGALGNPKLTGTRPAISHAPKTTTPDSSLRRRGLFIGQKS